MEELNKIIKKGEKYGNVEVSFDRTNELSLVFDNSNLKNLVEGNETELKIRVSKGKKFGFAVTSDLHKWENCLRDAVKIMKVSKPLEHEFPIVDKFKSRKIEGLYSKKVNSISAADLTSLGEDSINSIKKLKKEILIPNLYLSRVVNKSQFLNSNGISVKEKFSVFSNTVKTVLGSSVGMDSRVSHDIFDVHRVGKTSAQLCMEGAKPKSIGTGRFELILDYFAFSSLVSAIVVPSLCGNNVLSKRSYLQDKLNEKVFSDGFSVCDNGFLKNGLASSKSDSQGKERQKTVLVENGVVKNFLYDLYSAKLASAKSTGNCSSLKKVPAVGPSNFIIKNGDYKKEEIISETKKGIYTYFLAGTHVVNDVTGDVSVAVENAIFIKNGIKKYPIKQALISFNLFDALKNLKVLGKELRQESSIICPLVKLENVQVVG